MTSVRSVKNLVRIILLFSIISISLIPLGQQRVKPRPSGSASIEVGLRPAGVAVDAQTSRAVVANYNSNNVSVVDLSSGKVLTLAVGVQPLDVAIRPAPGPNDTNLAIVSHSGEGTISLIDLDKQTVVNTLEVGQAPAGVAVNAPRNLAVVANGGSDSVSVVDLSQAKVIDTIAVGEFPRRVAIHPTTNLAVVTNRNSHSVSFIDLNSDQVINEIAVKTQPDGVAINPEVGKSGIAAVTSRTADGGGQLTVIDLNDFSITAQIAVGQEPIGVAINTVTNIAVVANSQSHSVSLVDLEKGSVVNELAVGREPLGVAVHPDINQALVTDNGPDGGKGGTNPGVLELIALDYPIPTISQLSPASVVAGTGDFTLTISGSKFFSTSAVTFDDTALETNFINSRQLSVQVPAALIAQAKIAAITVTNPEPAGGTSDPVTFTINNPVPRITQLTPNELTAGGPDFELTVTGTGFVSGADSNSVVRFNNVAKRTTFVSATQLKAQIAAADIANPGTFPVVVTNPQPDGSSSNSNAVNFTNASPPPTISNFSPGVGPAGTAVTITGTNFVSVPPGNTTVTFAGLGDTQVTAVIARLANNALTAVVPLGTVTGKIRVTTRSGSAASGNDFMVTLPASFNVAAAPAMAEVSQGDSTSFDVRVESRDGFTGLVSLSAAGLPTGVSAQFNPSQIAPGGSSSTLHIRVDRSAATGQVAFRVQGQADISGRRVTSEANLSLGIISGNLTTASGRVVTSDDMPRPLVDVEVSVVRFEANPPPGRFVTIVPPVRTNAAGNFLLRNVPVGQQMLLVDGATARDPQNPARRFPPVEEPVNVIPSQANPTPFTIHLPAIDLTSRTSVPPNPPSDLRIPSPSLPNLEIRILAGTTITKPDGTVANEVTLTPVPTDRSPGLLPPGVVVPMLFSVQPGGAVPSQPVPVMFPNLLNTPPGTQMNLWTFDVSIAQWRIYGTGTVSQDGTQVVPDINQQTGRPYGIPRFAWHFPAPPPCSDPSTCGCVKCCSGGDPVALTSGTFYEMKTDIEIQGRVPISITRLYQTSNTNPGPFGIGTLDVNYGHRIQQQGTSFLYIVPSSRAFRFAPITGRPNQFENTTEPSLRGAVLTREAGDFNFTLRMKNGTVMRFDRVVGFSNLAALSAITDRNNNTITLTRISPGPGPERFGLLTEVRDPDGRTLRLNYDTGGRVTSVTDQIGRQATYTYNGAGYLETVINPEGGVTRYNYDAQGRVTEIINPRGNRVVLNEYDNNGRITRQTHADGGVFRYDYRVVGRLITETMLTDPRGNNTTYRFNCMSYPVSITDALGQTTVFDRSLGTNRVNFTQDPLGRRTEYRYDERGNIIEIKNAIGGIRGFEYEANLNRLTRIIDELNNSTIMRYDSRGNMIEATDSEGNSTSYAYNGFGQLVTATDALGNATRFEYSAQGNLTAIIDPEGHRWTLSYDALGRVIAQTNPRGQKVRSVYDARDRIIQTINEQGGTTRFTYDRNDNLLTITDPRANTVTLTYDSQDRLASRTDPLGNSDIYAYDQNGNLIRFTDRRGHISSFTYDALNRLIRTTRTDGSTTEQMYDPVWNLTRINDSVSGGIEFGYDPLDNLVRKVNPQGAISYEYDAASRRTRMAIAGQPDVLYRYDRATRLRQVQRGSDLVTIDYDRANRRTKLTLPNGVATEYTYNRASQLTGLTYKRPDGTIIDTINYAYSPNGSRISIRGTVPYGTRSDPVSTTDYNRANQLLRFGNKTFTYDRNGNLETETSPSGTVQYQWDTRNRLTSISGTGLQARFTYDALGRRIKKEMNGQSTGYLYAGLDIVQELSDSGIRATYLRGRQLDEPFTRIEETTRSHYLVDGLNSTVFLTDDNGNRVQQYAYDPYGRLISQSGSVDQPFTYTGRELDQPSRLYYYRARYYDPSAGRFLSQDPIGSNSRQNLYVYVGDNPVNRLDPRGLQGRRRGLGFSETESQSNIQKCVPFCVLGGEPPSRFFPRRLPRKDLPEEGEGTDLPSLPLPFGFSVKATEDDDPAGVGNAQITSPEYSLGPVNFHVKFSAGPGISPQFPDPYPNKKRPVKPEPDRNLEPSPDDPSGPGCLFSITGTFPGI